MYPFFVLRIILMLQTIRSMIFGMVTLVISCNFNLIRHDVCMTFEDWVYYDLNF